MMTWRATIIFASYFLLGSSRATAGIAPMIVKQPQPALVRAGNTLDLSVGVSGEAPLSYTWYRERTPLQKPQNALLTIDRVTQKDAGLYWVIVSNRWGRVGSDGALVSVGAYQRWTKGIGGNDHGYEFVRSGNRENDWQKMFNTVKASGGYLVSLQSEAEEEFVNDLEPSFVTRLIGLIQPLGSQEPSGGWVWMSGEPVTFTHWAPREPSNGGDANKRGFENLVGVNSDGSWNDIHGGGRAYIIEYPTDLVIYSNLTNSVVAGYDEIALRAGVASGRPLAYTWYLNGKVLPGITNGMLPSKAVPSSGGTFYFTVTDGVSTLRSHSAEVLCGPIIKRSPASQAVPAGGLATLSVSVTGPGPFNFQWYRDGVLIPDAVGENYVIPKAAPSDEGNYSVEITNPNGSITSAEAYLVVVLPDRWLVLLDDFEHGQDSGWSLPVTTVPPIGGRRFLGEFGQEQVTLTLTNLPEHAEIEISADVIVRGYWEGNKRPDTWQLSVDNSPLFVTTFGSYGSQAFPNALGEGEHSRGEEALAINSLGYELSFADNKMIEDAIYRVQARGTHTNQKAVIAFASELGHPWEAGWSLDNVVVLVKNAVDSKKEKSAQGQKNLELAPHGASSTAPNKPTTSLRLF